MSRTRFLIVNSDPEVYNLITGAIFSEKQFEFFRAMDGAEGIEMVAKHAPDLILLDLVMPGLTGHDMMVGIKNKGYRGPIIVTTQKGNELKAIDAFRLGATDFVITPLRPPELVAAVERALQEVRLRQEKAELIIRLEHTNKNLEDRLNELTTLSDLGQSISRVRSLDELFDVVLNSTLTMTGADHASLILRESENGQLRLQAGKNMPLAMQDKVGEIIKDDMAELILTSKEPLVVAGEGAQPFGLSREIRAVVYVPLLIQEQAIGVLTAGNHRKRNEFDANHARILKALADYAAIGITNARLFATLDIRARRMEAVIGHVHRPLLEINMRLEKLTAASLPEAVAQQIQAMRQLTHSALQVTTKVTAGSESSASASPSSGTEKGIRGLSSK